MFFSRVKKQKKESVIIIGKKIKYYTKESLKLLTIIMFSFGLIIAILLLEYRPVYSVTLSEEEVGFINNKEEFIETVNKEILENKEQNVEFVSINVKPKYELKLIKRSEETSENKVLSQIKENTTVTYKFYEVSANDQTSTYVSTLDEATDVVNKLNDEYNKSDSELNLKIVEKYTKNKDEIKVEEADAAENKLYDEIIEKEKERERQEKAIEEKNVLANINGVKISVKPVNGTITSRYAERSRIRRSSHTGLDIACSKGTPINVVAEGTITFAARNGSYGNLVKVDHGNGVETWYAHCNKILTSVGKKVNPGDKIAEVGSTGNSTGPHLHLEIRINGSPVNPQNYLYK